MKKLALAAISATTIFLSGCNIVAPDARVDQTEITKKMTFADVKFRYISAFYNGNKKEQQIYWRWLVDNHERVNPFLNLKEWRKEVEKQHIKDVKIVNRIDESIKIKNCYDLENEIVVLYSIWYKTNWKKAEIVRFKIALKMNENHYIPLMWESDSVVLHPVKHHEWLMNDKANDPKDKSFIDYRKYTRWNY